MRKKISKETRQAVYNKYNGHCAYCGCELPYEDMQVDHLHSFGEQLYRKNISDDAINDFSNLMPSCKMCNFYKSIFTLEEFRAKLTSLLERVNKPFIYRLAKKYGMVSERQWDGKFYFEINKKKGE